MPRAPPTPTMFVPAPGHEGAGGVYQLPRNVARPDDINDVVIHSLFGDGCVALDGRCRFRS